MFRKVISVTLMFVLLANVANAANPCTQIFNYYSNASDTLVLEVTPGHFDAQAVLINGQWVYQVVWDATGLTESITTTSVKMYGSYYIGHVAYWQSENGVNWNLKVRKLQNGAFVDACSLFT